MSTISARCFGTTGPTVVLVHGWCCSGDFWRGQVATFAHHYRLIVLDLGHPDPGTDDLSMSAAGVEVAEFIAPHLETCAIVGHSMGGPIALEAAIRLGERCRLVVGVDTFTDPAFYRGLGETEVAARLAPFRRDFRGMVKAMVKRIAVAGGSELRREIGDAMGSAPKASALPRLAALLAWDIESVWRSVPCPIAAINSALLARPDQRIELDGLSETLMADVGHFPMLEAAEIFNRHLARILGEQ
jgi:sigma-B regulation protein RsbQ